ncbi:MAG TPA: D-alanyl-D-alanine carboxypeptidase/D-alanyl-D-alanine-endopeptidase [Planctomycetota bacterium]|nr:D-alanyl-D-alanine carboxypeptidase/D-alanyl-D-alanine-endopeptidase [Planctomycetota bacterium]
MSRMETRVRSNWTALAAVAALAVALEAPRRGGAEGPSRPDLERAIEKVLARPELKGSTIGICVARVKSGEVIHESGADRLLPPASNTKILSCAGALATLGKDFRFETRVVAAGPIEGGRLRGDIVLVAAGDPNLSQRVSAGRERILFADKDHSYAGFFEASLVKGDPLRVVKDLARQVEEAGVKAIDGDVVVDDGLFADTDDDFVGALSAICINDNLVDVTVSPGARPGEPARVEVQPEGSLVDVRSSARTGAEGVQTSLWLEPREGPASFELMGTVSPGAEPVLRTGSFREPAVAAAGFLADALLERGIAAAGRPRRSREGPEAHAQKKVLARHVSPPLSEALRVVLKVSQNLHATMLPPLVGALRAGRGDRRSGYRVIHDAFEREGLDMDAVSIWSGSGGGRGDQVSARWMVSFLRHLAGRKDFPAFLDALPVGGVDGTLANAFTDAAFEGRIRAKTGTLVYRSALNDRWVYVSKALSGYVDPGGAGRPEDLLAFSILIANTLTSGKKKGSDDLFRVQEDILRAVIESCRNK